MATIWHDRLAVEPCKVVIWYDHFWISRSPVLFSIRRNALYKRHFFR